MTLPTEAQFIEMEKRARWLLDGVDIQRQELERQKTASRERKKNPTFSDYVRVDTQEQIAHDVLLLVEMIRKWKVPKRLGTYM